MACCQRAPVVWAVSALLLQLAATASSQTQSQQTDVTCPLHYRRHNIEDFSNAALKPYLFGGIYNSDRECINCKRGGLWSDFCSFKVTEKMKDAPFWSHQLCKATTVDSIIKRSMQMDDAADLLSMTPCDLWQYLRGRTTWIIGDSMSKDLYKALRCFMLEFTDLKTYHASNNFTAMHHLDSLPGFGEPHCMHMPQHTRICQVHAIQGDLFIEGNRTQIGVLPLLQESLARSHDIFIMNFGLWHGETRQEEYRQNLHQLGKFFKATKGNFSNLFWMETPKQHFDSADGDYKVAWIGTRKGPFQCQAVKGVSMNPDWSVSAADGDAVAEYVMKGSWRNIMAREILQQQYDVPVLPVYNSTATAWEYHRQNFDGQECSHYCHPSVPQLWLYVLKQTLQKYKVAPLSDDEYKELNKRRWPGCASVLDRDEGKLGGPKPVDHMIAQLRQQHHKAKPAGFWGWLRSVFGGGSSQQQQLRIELVDGVAVLHHRHSGRVVESSEHQSGGSYSHTATLQPWKNLAVVLGHKQQQEHKQRRQHGEGV